MKKIVNSTILALAAVGFSGSAMAQFAKPDDAIKYRKSALFLMQQHYSRVAAMAAGKVPFNAASAAENAQMAETLSHLPWAAFGDGTDLGDTKASAKIWDQKAKFKELSEKLETEMGKLAAAAKTGNLDSIKAAVKATSGTCKSCHDSFREK